MRFEASAKVERCTCTEGGLRTMNGERWCFPERVVGGRAVSASLPEAGALRAVREQSERVLRALRRL
eukprot:365177-Chlamydomonas_euryale.AAC.3